MPTSRPRYLLTESDRLREALQQAGARWPEDRDRPTALLLHLIDEGRHALDAEADERRRRRLHAIQHAADGLEGVYYPGHLAELREDWPD